MDIISVTNARKELYKLLDLVQDTHKPIHIVGKRSSGVLISKEDFAAIEETLYLQQIPGMAESIIEGMSSPIEQCDEEIEW